ncbi:MAG: hypothetical protein GJ680_04630 [Alteromonadaceae bacterium]|nr:hypothetical protein [Alteromonadaceae bacterium]
MKSILIKLFSPILNQFETQDVAPNYKSSHRIALNVVGSLFLVLSIGAGYAARFGDDLGFFIPVVVFFCLGLVALVVGTLGSNGAVWKIWGTK